MKKLYIVLFLISLSTQAQQKAAVDYNTARDIEIIKDKYEYILKNFEIQNQSILYISTIFGFLLTIVIVYFGWKALKVENEYEKIQEQRDVFNKRYEKIFDDISVKINNISKVETDILKIKEQLLAEKDSMHALIEKIILNHTDEFLTKHIENISLTTTNDSDERITEFDKKMGLLSEQLKLLENIHHESNPGILYKRIDLLFESKRYIEVESLIRGIKDENNFNKAYLFKYAFVLSENGLIDEAKRAYLEYLEFKPDSSGALNNLAVIYKKQLEIEKAKEHYKKALSISVSALYVRNLASCFEEVNDMLNVYLSYKDSLKDDEQYNKDYQTFLEQNFLIEELLNYYKGKFTNDNSDLNYLSFYEVSILSRNEREISYLDSIFNNYNFSVRDRIILIFLKIADKFLKNIDPKNELTDLNILLEQSGVIEIRWRFNLIKNITSHINNPEYASQFTTILNRLEGLH